MMHNPDLGNTNPNHTSSSAQMHSNQNPGFQGGQPQNAGYQPYQNMDNENSPEYRVMKAKESRNTWSTVVKILGIFIMVVASVALLLHVYNLIMVTLYWMQDPRGENINNSESAGINGAIVGIPGIMAAVCDILGDLLEIYAGWCSYDTSKKDNSSDICGFVKTIFAFLAIMVVLQIIKMSIMYYQLRQEVDKAYEGYDIPEEDRQNINTMMITLTMTTFATAACVICCCCSCFAGFHYQFKRTQEKYVSSIPHFLSFILMNNIADSRALLLFGPILKYL